jgi:hypothetical protein
MAPGLAVVEEEDLGTDLDALGIAGAEILVADYAIDRAAKTASCARAEIIRRIALEADALDCDVAPP